MNLGEIVCATTFRQGSPNDLIEKIRTEVFFNTAREMSSVGLPLVAVYIETQNHILATLRHLGVVLAEQQSAGMGNIRREVFTMALSHFPNAKYLCWLEPEKPNLVRFIVPMVYHMEQEKAVLGMFNRIDMTSYPPEQAHYYLFCRSIATHFIGFDIDYAFGPMAMEYKVVPYFLEYQGEYGDKWDSILIPRLRIIKDGLTVSIFAINFQNDPRMTRVETGNPAIILRRLKQLNNVIPSLVAEWQRLDEM